MSGALRHVRDCRQHTHCRARAKGRACAGRAVTDAPLAARDVSGRKHLRSNFESSARVPKYVRARTIHYLAPSPRPRERVHHKSPIANLLPLCTDAAAVLQIEVPSAGARLARWLELVRSAAMRVADPAAASPLTSSKPGRRGGRARLDSARRAPPSHRFLWSSWRTRCRRQATKAVS